MSTINKTKAISRYNIDGEGLYQKRARSALPLLIRQAKAEQNITYEDLAYELGMPNPRNLNYVLGAIGNDLTMLCKELGYSIPHIQALVVNKATKLPGKGFMGFVFGKNELKNLSTNMKKEKIKEVYKDIFLFPHWDTVLSRLKLKPADLLREVNKEKVKQLAGQGESEDHRRLKNKIAQNPAMVGVISKHIPGEVEFWFDSCDEIDVLFLDEGLWTGIEVKPRNAPIEDVRRGLFQCIKYAALIEAMQKLKGIKPCSRVILATGGPFPTELLDVKNILGIEVCEKLDS